MIISMVFEIIAKQEKHEEKNMLVGEQVNESQPRKCTIMNHKRKYLVIERALGNHQDFSSYSKESIVKEIQFGKKEPQILQSASKRVRHLERSSGG